MKTTGVVRRLDELGRVVIPKEIRKRLKINSGDMVDISIDDASIILQKYHPLNQDIMPISSLLNALKEEYKSDFIVFDNSKVIYSTIDLKDYSLSNEFTSKINSYLETEISNKLRIQMFNDYEFDKDMYIEKIFVDYECYGYACVLDDIISKRQKEALKIIINYFEHYLKS